MNHLFSKIACTALLLCSVNGYSQVITEYLNTEEEIPVFGQPSCGAHHLIEHMDDKAPGAMELSNGMMDHLMHIISSQQEDRNYVDLYVIPVVFHVLYNTPEENIPDSVLFNQIEVLNDCFRRFNEDAINLRPEFLDLVGDSKIQFELAIDDPFGSPTTGITRTATTVENFGGILPYNSGQSAEIQAWVDDSLYYNMFRLTETALGGEDAWDTEEYLNIWMGDLTIYEPLIGNAEELVFFALATPPISHTSWPASITDPIAGFEQGVLMHYVNVGANNPNSFAAPYTAYNGLTTTGKIMVHEVGHYLGLRHIWGDGGCNDGDYIADTPNSNNSSNWACNQSANFCIDDINGVDLPNMVENYMDYSSASCQNSFTIGQSDMMRAAILTYRPDLAEVISTVSLDESVNLDEINVYPNPTRGKLFVNLGNNSSSGEIIVKNTLGQIILIENSLQSQIAELEIDAPKGIYFLTVNLDNEASQTIKFIIE
jgi:hypothetical protein